MSKRPSTSARHSTWKQSFTDRANLPNTSALSAYLFQLIVAKQSNLCLSADVQSTSELLDIAEECGTSICMLKTHADIIHDFGERTIKGLIDIASRKKFLIFEDRKFGDIGNTVQAQYVAGPFRIASWANIVNAHIFPGPAIITSMKSAASSAVVAYNTSTSTEISGGDMSPGSGKSPKQSTRLQDSDDDGEESDEDDEEEEQESENENEDEQVKNSGVDITSVHQTTTSNSQAIDIPERSAESYQRKPSVISINTTISSSTEVLKSPSDQRSPSLTLPGRTPIARGLLLLAEMSSEGHMFTSSYMVKCLELARQHRDFVLGFIAQGALNKEPGDNFLVLTPGVNMPSADSSTSTKPRSQSAIKGTSSTTKGVASKLAATKGDGQGQQYNTPRYVVLEKGVDVIIVGRGILNAEDREAEAERYRSEAWKALRERTGG